MTLATTIMHLRELARLESETEPDRSSLIQEWRDEIAAVFTLIRSALKSYEDEGVATFANEDVALSEEGLGEQVYQRLVIEIVGRRIVIAPVARFTAGGSGRIDMYRENRPTEDQRVLMLRGLAVQGHDNTEWWIEQKGEFLVPAPGASNGFARGWRHYQVIAPHLIESAIDYLLNLA